MRDHLRYALDVLALLALWLLNALMLACMIVAGAVGVAAVLYLLTRAVRLGWGC